MAKKKKDAKAKSKVKKAAEKKSESNGIIERVPTCIKGLDSQIQGGIPKGFVNIICGVAGTLKSSITFNILYNEALKGRNSFYISLEQSYKNLSMHLKNLNIDLTKVNIALANINNSSLEYINKSGDKVGTIIFLDIPSTREELSSQKRLGDMISVSVMSKLIDNITKKMPFEYLALDSLNALYALLEMGKSRDTFYTLFEMLRAKKLTSFLIHEVIGGENSGQYGVEDSLADSVILLDLARYERIVQRELSVKKMRATKSNINVFTLSVTNNGFAVSEGGSSPVIDFNQ